VDWKITLAIAGWFFALTQFAFTYRETRSKNEAELLEKTLNFLTKVLKLELSELVWSKGFGLKNKKT
jgi:hypothetical protein